VPELQPHERTIVEFICTQINEDMKTVGLDEAQMLAIFTFAFREGVDVMYQWHKSPDGKINELKVGNPLNPFFSEHVLLQSLPDGVRQIVESSDVPRVVCGIMASWWAQHKNDLRKNGIDIWQPLALALSLTFRLAVSIALKMFGYRK
jgi:hypothetical protein